MYIGYLLEKMMAPHSINCHLTSIRGFYDYLCDEEGVLLENPVIMGLMLREHTPFPDIYMTVMLSCFWAVYQASGIGPYSC